MDRRADLPCRGAVRSWSSCQAGASWSSQTQVQSPAPGTGITQHVVGRLRTDWEAALWKWVMVNNKLNGKSVMWCCRDED